MAATTEPASVRQGDTVKTVSLSLLAGLGYGILAYICVELPRAHGVVTPIWLSNAFVIACLLAVDARRWPWILAGALIGGLAAGAHAGDAPVINLVLTGANVVQAWLCAWATRRLLGLDVDLGRPRHMVIFVLVAGILVPLVTGAAAAVFHTATRGGDLWGNLWVWVLGDILGVLTLSTCLLVLSQARTYLAERGPSLSGALAMLGLIAVSLLVFFALRLPLLFVIPPVMLLVAWQLEVLGAVVGAVIVATIAIIATVTGFGPLQTISDQPVVQLVLLQVFLAVSIFVSLPVAAFQRQRRYILDRMARASEAVARSEASYRMLTENALDLIIHSDLTGKVTYMSPSSMAMLGYQPEEMIGHRAIELVHPDDFDSVTQFSVDQVKGGPAPTDRIEYRAFRKDGSILWLESRPTLARDPVTGRKIGITDVVRDVTERKAMEQQLRESQVRAEAAAAAKGEFLANMSHELRTPLTAVLGFAGMIEGQPDLSPMSRRHLARIIDGGTALLATINDILDFSKLDAGQMQIRPRPVSLPDLVRDVLEIFGPQASAKGLTLTASGLEGIPEQLEADPDRIRQVLLNLIGNALKFTDRGGVAVDLTYDAAAGRLDVGVQDTGQGIAPEDIGRLFTRFSQIDASISRQHGGAGLGLAISRGLVEAMGGSIRVASRLGEGSRFAFELPVRPPGDTSEAVAEDAPPLPALPPGCRVLVVDDNAANRELVRTVLEAFSVNVSEAVDGEDGVRAAEGGSFDLILMDLRMPRLDGIRAAEQIRSGQGPSARAPIIAFSADVRSGPTAPVFSGSVAKPMTVASLVGTIAAALAA